MKISTNTRYALRLLIYMGDTPISTQRIATQQGISARMLERICSKLVKNGILKSVRGQKGGHILAKDPKDISVGEIMRLMETGSLPMHCMQNPQQHCEVYNNCVLHNVWQQIIDAMYAAADDISLADIKTHSLLQD